MFAGGYKSSTYYSTVDAYNTSLTRSTPTELSNNISEPPSTTIGNYALFATSKISDAYNSSLVKTTHGKAKFTQYIHGAISIGEYALFGGSGAVGGHIDVYDKNLNKVG